MPTLTERDKRTIRIAAIGIAIYLALFYGVRGWKHIEARRSEYQRLVQAAQNLKLELQRYENKMLRVEKLRENFKLDLAKLPKASLVGETSAAIQRAAQSGGIQLGPIRESPGSASGKERAVMQLEGTGPVPAIVAFFHRLETLGFPVIVDSAQFTPVNTGPGMVKLNLTIIILDCEQWKAANA